ncbi:MAG: S9 family peptidase, partial [Bacteroidales bacterium]|nr:S9 family peptidase [Bacteroidales bacterium]
IATAEEKRLTFDGSEVILNGYASWVYYEEIFGRPSRYRAFWWSPDSRKLAFYRFDNSSVPVFPIYSAVGQDGSLRRTRYPKAGEPNPEVRIGVVDGFVEGVEGGSEDGVPAIVWADFDYSADGYFGTPFWGDDSSEIYITQMPRVQNTLDLYAVTVADGSKRHVYNEKYGTWVDWIEDMLFTDEGLYMARSFETGWEQIYFLSYDGKVRRLTEGENWRIHLLRVNEDSGEVFFTACRDSRLCAALYKLDSEGNITALTDPSLNVASVSFSTDGRYIAASLSTTHTPTKVIVSSVEGASVAPASLKAAEGSAGASENAVATVVADMADEGFDPSNYALPELVWLTTEDGFSLPAQITYPYNFDPAMKYPVHVDIYGGPDTPLVRERWTLPFGENQWWAENGIIEVVADCRAAGHNGRAGTDMIYRDLISWPVRDFVTWADYLKSLPYVDGDKIGVEGFSFGGSMTAALVFTASDSYHYGIAGGGVYDWALYDSHYTERFMDTPQNNPEGYAAARVLNMVQSYPADYKEAAQRIIGGSPAPVMLRITHGTGDDNVHFQNTLQLIDELQRNGKEFELMIYPDGMHGYRGHQARHFDAGNHAFWLRHLKGE